MHLHQPSGRLGMLEQRRDRCGPDVLAALAAVNRNQPDQRIEYVLQLQAGESLHGTHPDGGHPLLGGGGVLGESGDGVGVPDGRQAVDRLGQGGHLLVGQFALRLLVEQDEVLVTQRGKPGGRGRVRYGGHGQSPGGVQRVPLGQFGRLLLPCLGLVGG